MRYLVLAWVLSACAFADGLDGHIDEQKNCCGAVTTSRIRECLAKFSEPGMCWEIECLPPIGTVDAYLWHDGHVSSCPKEEQ